MSIQYPYLTFLFLLVLSPNGRAGLLERCVQPTAPLRDISGFVPDKLQSRIRIVPKPSSSAVLKSAKEAKRKLDGRSKDDSETTASTYFPLILESNTKHTAPLYLPSSAASSARIPGALVVDPRVRKIADAAGMKASENAIWLLVVALKEYTKTVLDDTLSTIKAVETDSIPRGPSIRTQLLPKKRPAADSSVSSAPATVSANHPDPTKSITPMDIHTTIASMSCGSRSLGGCLSRATFERSLFSSFDNSFVAGGNAFNEVKRFVVSAVTPPEPKRTKVEPPKTNVNEGVRKSPVSRGLGRGAKDLASLKARSSFSKSDTSVGSSIAAANEASGDADVRAEPATPTQTMEISAHSPQELEKRVDSGSATIQSPGTPRKGKGFGVKNLAAMRARSLTSHSEDKGDAAKAASAAADESKESLKKSGSLDEATTQAAAPVATPAPARATASAANSAGTAPPSSGLSTTEKNANAPLTGDRPAPDASIASAASSSNQDFPGHRPSQSPARTVQNPALALANAQLAQGLANALMQNTGQAPPAQNAQRPTLAPYPGQAPQLAFNQFGQMVPGLQQGQLFGQVPQAPVGTLMQNVAAPSNTATSAAQSAQAMVFANAVAQNIANAAAVVSATTNPSQSPARVAAAPNPGTSASLQTAQAPATTAVAPLNPNVAQAHPVAGPRAATRSPNQSPARVAAPNTGTLASSQTAQAPATTAVAPPNPKLAPAQPLAGPRAATTGASSPNQSPARVAAPNTGTLASSQTAQAPATTAVAPPNPKLAPAQPVAGPRAATTGSPNPAIAAAAAVAAPQSAPNAPTQQQSEGGSNDAAAASAAAPQSAPKAPAQQQSEGGSTDAAAAPQSAPNAPTQQKQSETQQQSEGGSNDAAAASAAAPQSAPKAPAQQQSEGGSTDAAAAAAPQSAPNAPKQSETQQQSEGGSTDAVAAVAAAAAPQSPPTAPTQQQSESGSTDAKK